LDGSGSAWFSALSAGWPVRAKNTSSSEGWRTSTSSTVIPAASSARTTVLASPPVLRTGARRRRPSWLACTGPATSGLRASRAAKLGSLELHLRLHALGREALEQLERLEDGQARADAWPGLLDRFIDQVLENRDLVLLHQRNYNALEELTNNERHQAENDDIEQQFRRVLESPAIPLAQRVRMACSVGAVVGALVGGEGLFGDVPMDEIVELVREAVHDLLGSSETASLARAE
jgi:hypothetical protein